MLASGGNPSRGPTGRESAVRQDPGERSNCRPRPFVDWSLAAGFWGAWSRFLAQPREEPPAWLPVGPRRCRRPGDRLAGIAKGSRQRDAERVAVKRIAWIGPTCLHVIRASWDREVPIRGHHTIVPGKPAWRRFQGGVTSIGRVVSARESHCWRAGQRRRRRMVHRSAW